jgi:hypothetical protein
MLVTRIVSTKILMNVKRTWITVNTIASIPMDLTPAPVCQDTDSIAMDDSVMVSLCVQENRHPFRITHDFSLMNIDINECIARTDNCDSICSNTIGSYVCSCLSGYRLQSDGATCRG